MKSIKVAAAVIIDKDGRIFATERGYGEFKDGWEFPGGKLEEGESAEEALKREIKEELDTVIEIENHLTTVEYDYPNFHISMEVFIAHLVEGNLTLLEHEASAWLDKNSLDSVAWLPADIEAVNKLKEYLKI